MLWAVIPVKSLSKTKSRLAPMLSQPARTQLTLSLLKRQLKLLWGIAAIDAVLVVTRDLVVSKVARACGCYVLAEEDETNDLNAALEEARDLLKGEATELLILPSDLPLISAESVKTIISKSPNAVICSDRHGSGTNALLTRTDALIQFQYGHNSFHKHQVQLTKAGILFERLSLPDIAFDLDTPADWALWQQACAL